MAGFTARDLKARPVAEAPNPEAVTSAAAHIDAARQSLLRAAHQLDDSSTRHVHRKTLELLDRMNSLQIELTEWGG